MTELGQNDQRSNSTKRASMKSKIDSLYKRFGWSQKVKNEENDVTSDSSSSSSSEDSDGGQYTGKNPN